MRFLADEMKGQLAESHPELVLLLSDFEMWSHKEQLPEPTICELWRTKKQQGEIYFRIWRDEAKKTLANPRALEASRLHAKAIMAMPEKDLRALAEKKFTGHLVGAAADIRTRHYSEAQLLKVGQWFRERCGPPIWEVVTQPHGTGAHAHIGRRDYSWRKKREAGNV